MLDHFRKGDRADCEYSSRGSSRLGGSAGVAASPIASHRSAKDSHPFASARRRTSERLAPGIRLVDLQAHLP